MFNTYALLLECNMISEMNFRGCLDFLCNSNKTHNMCCSGYSVSYVDDGVSLDVVHV